MSGWMILSSIVAAIAIGTLIFKIGGWVEKVDADSKNFRGLMEKIRKDLKEIRNDLGKILGRLHTASVSSDGPLQLSDMGGDISQTLQAGEWAAGIAPKIMEQVDGRAPYEIQEFCFEYVRKKFEPSAELEAKIGMCVYNNGIDKDGVLDSLGD